MAVQAIWAISSSMGGVSTGLREKRRMSTPLSDWAKPVDAPTFRGNETIEWQVGGVGSPSVLEWGADQYMFFIGATEYEEPDDPFLEPFMSRIGVARRVGGEGEWVYVRDLPLTFATASPTRVRVALAGEWAMVYMRDLYHGAVVHEDPFDALGLMLVHMPELEGGS